MPTWSWIVIAVVIVVIVVLALIAAASMMRKKRSDRLKGRFGPEYERAVDTAGGQRAAEKELLARERKHNKLDINELTPESRARYLQAWQVTQAGFVDNPAKSVSEADRIVTEVLRERGYPVDDFEQQAATISVDHPAVVEHYRAGHILHLAQERGDIGTEAQREAIVHYRALFKELLGSEHESPPHNETLPHNERLPENQISAEHETGTDSPKEARA